MADLIKTVGIIIISVILYFYPEFKIIDPIYTIFLSFAIIGSTIEPVDDCVHELLGGAPSKLDIKALRKKLKAIEGVEKLYDLHVWNLSE